MHLFFRSPCVKLETASRKVSKDSRFTPLTLPRLVDVNYPDRLNFDNNNNYDNNIIIIIIVTGGRRLVPKFTAAV